MLGFKQLNSPIRTVAFGSAITFPHYWEVGWIEILCPHTQILGFGLGKVLFEEKRTVLYDKR